LEELKRDRKEYKDLIVQELQKFSKNLSDNAIITSVLQNENVAISLAIAKKIKEYIDALSEKYIKNEI
jgi:glutaredoxin 2